MATIAGVVESKIRSKLLSQLDAKHLDVINESYMHNVPKGSETHFKVVVVSPKFEGLPLIKVSRLSVPMPQESRTFIFFTFNTSLDFINSSLNKAALSCMQVSCLILACNDLHGSIKI